jgi:hypothetical protein
MDAARGSVAYDEATYGQAADDQSADGDRTQRERTHRGSTQGACLHVCRRPGRRRSVRGHGMFQRYANLDASNPSGSTPVGLIISYGPRGRNCPVPGSACTLPSRIATRPPFTVATGQPVTSSPSYGV